MRLLAATFLACTLLSACALQTAPTRDTVTAQPDAERISAAEAWDRIDRGALVLDVRTRDEFERGHLPGAINVPHTEIRESRFAADGFNKEREIVIYCGSGRRAGIAQRELIDLGFEHTANAGGYSELVAAQ